MLLNIKDENLPNEKNRVKWLIFTSLMILPFSWILIDLILRSDIQQNALHVEDFGTIHDVGLTLFSEWVLPFELVSILLLVALIGSVTLVKKDNR